MLYANGRIILSEGFEENGEWRYRLWSKVYSRAETCSILNTIDRTGFLDYNVSDYHPQSGDFFSTDGASLAAITVNTWKPIQGVFYGLGSYLYVYGASSPVMGLPGSPLIPPSLRETYFFLSSYPREGLESYQSQRLGLAVTKFLPIDRRPDTEFQEWPFDDISLAELEKATSLNNYPAKFSVIEGQQALSVYSFFRNSYDPDGETMRQNGHEYLVFLRPILPYEIPQFDTWNTLPDPSVKSPGFELECFPTDGTLLIPAPTVP